MVDPSLVPTLKKQHAALAESLGGFTNKTPSSADIKRFTVALLAHLNLEDTKLYPALADGGAVSRAVASGFQMTMTSLAKAATAFVQKWSENEPSSDEAAFHNELRVVVEKLSERIRTEEEKLYPLVEKL